MPILHLLSIVFLFCMGIIVSSNTLRGFPDDICDPHTVTSEHYPSLIVRLSVQKTSPLKLKATYRLPNSTKEFSFEGIVYSGNFLLAAETAACRSLGCSKSAGATSMAWTTQTECEFTCPDGTSALQKCRFMIRDFQCPADAMSLLECLTDEKFWLYGSHIPGSSYRSIDLKCAECGD